jgi:hypothetical protein
MSDQRDRLLGRPRESARATQAAKGHITRRLLVEIKQLLDEVGAPGADRESMERGSK